jgi:hypothetical protein
MVPKFNDWRFIDGEISENIGFIFKDYQDFEVTG